MDVYSRRMLKLVFCAFCLVVLAAVKVNDNFNRIVQPESAIEVFQVEGLTSSKPNLTLVGINFSLPDLVKLGNLNNLKNLKNDLVRKGELARDKALAMLDQVRETKWDSLAKWDSRASKKTEKRGD